MQVNAKVITSALCLSGLAYAFYHHGPVPSAPRGYASAALELGEPELVIRQTLASVDGDAEVEARRSLGRLYEREWRLLAAQTELEAALSAARPLEHFPAQLDLARVLLKRGDIDGARRAAGGLPGPAVPEAQAGVSPADVARLRGDVAKAGGLYAAAKEHYAAARSKATNQDDIARVSAAECDLFQLERRLAPARQRCEQALARQLIGHPERPATLKTLGLIYYFGGEPKRALGLHNRSQEGFVALGSPFEARWVREFAIDDEASLVEDDDAPALEPLIAELRVLEEQLHVGAETVWWRVSDAQLRLADMLRRTKRFEEAEQAVHAGLAAFHKRPAGWERVPDYATVFELAGLVAKDQGKTKECLDHLTKSLNILEGIVGLSTDASYLREEINALQAEVETDAMSGMVLDVSQL